MRSFVFLWCGSGEGLDLGRMVLDPSLCQKFMLNFRKPLDAASKITFEVEDNKETAVLRHLIVTGHELQGQWFDSRYWLHVVHLSNTLIPLLLIACITRKSL